MFNFFKRIPSIAVTELEQKLTRESVLLDVRTPAEYQAGHLPRAKNVPLNQVGQYQQKRPGQLYVICQSGMRSKQAARILRQKGYDVVNVRGGMSQWSGQIRGGQSR